MVFVLLEVEYTKTVVRLVSWLNAHLTSQSHASAAHYPAEAEFVLKGLSNPDCFVILRGSPSCSRIQQKNRISYKDLAGQKVFNPQNMSVAQLKTV